MSFNLNESKTYINVKLTDAGRRQLALGKLVFAKAVLSDREINYGIDRTGYFDIADNRILSPSDAHPDIDIRNLDGSNAFSLTNQEITVAKIFTTATTNSSQFFSASTTSGVRWDFVTSVPLGTSTLSFAAQTWNSTTITFTAAPPAGVGDLVFIPWLAPQNGTVAIPATYPNIPQSTPFIGLWYRLVSAITSSSFIVDRQIPRFGAVAHTQRAIFYPYDAIENYYGSATTQSPSLWNLNIVRTKTIAGTDDASGAISGYTRYGSLNYSGTKKYFGFSSETPTVGFIHHTNYFSGNSTGEQLVEKTVKIHMPMVQWHKAGLPNGLGAAYGPTFYDEGGNTTYDDIAKTTYRNLCDNKILSAGTIVGRVYHKLKIIVITDQEILNALSYKSNRNYTYPEPIVKLGSTPKWPLTTIQASGLCKSDYTYFVTYIPESDSYSSSVSYGLPDAIHCGYIKKIKGQNDINGHPQYLNISFPANSFPYMRNDSGISSGTGWNANYVQVLVSEQPTSLNYDVSDVPPTSWKRCSVRSSGGNGIYRASDDGDNTIDPNNLNNNTFTISQQDYTSGTTYVLNSGMTNSQSNLNFGYESFFHGIVEATYLKTSYKSVVSVFASNKQFLNSKNSTFNKYFDDNIYVTEMAILDNNNQVVAVGKPTYPLTKSPDRYLFFQIQIDF